MTKSITSKLIVLLTLSTAIIIALGTAIDYRLSRDEIMTRLEHESVGTINAVVNDLEYWLESVAGTTKFLGRILEQREYTLPGLEQMLKDIVENNNDVFGATIALNPALVDSPLGFAPYYYRKDNVLSYADLTQGEDKYWQRTWYLEAVIAGKPIWVEPYFDAAGGQVLMTTFSVPVYRIDGDNQRFLYAVVTADVALDQLHHHLQRLRLGKSGYGILLSRKGIILSARDPKNIMQHHLKTAGDTTDIESWNTLFAGALNGQVMTHQLECPELPGGCMIRLAALRSTGWPVGVIYVEDEILAPLRNYQLKSALLALVTLLAMAIVVALVSRRLTRPLKALTEVTDQIAQGHLDVPLPRTQGNDEVARLIEAFAAMKRNLKNYIADLESVTAARGRLEGELAAATEIQMAMLPQGGEALEQCSIGYSIWAKVRPAKAVGGDLYSYYSRGNDQLFIAVGDVSDKGVPAALFMAKTISHIQQYSDAFTEPERGMALLNNALESGNSNCMFVTLFFGVLDLNSGLLRFASAGHTPPSLLRNGTSRPVSQESGPALGLAPDLEFPVNSLRLQAGDRLAVYTDGIDEAFNEKNEMFGCERFDRELERTHEASIADAGVTILQTLDQFAGSAAQSDDITLLLLDFPGEPIGNRLDRVTQSFAPGPLLTSRVDDWLREVLRTLALDEGPAMELTLVSEEVVTNIDKYAQIPHGSEIEMSISATGDEIHLEFCDAGVAFNPLLEAKSAVLGQDIESAQIGGLGVHLIRELTNRQHYQRRSERNILRVTKVLS